MKALARFVVRLCSATLGYHCMWHDSDSLQGSLNPKAVPFMNAWIEDEPGCVPRLTSELEEVTERDSRCHDLGYMEQFPSL